MPKSGNQLYVCEESCVGRRQERVDALVRQLTIERLRMPDLLDGLRPDDGAAAEVRARLAGLRARLAMAADSFAEAQIDGEQLARISASLRAQQQEAERELRRLFGPSLTVVQNMAGPDAERLWDAAHVPAQRAVLQGLGARVLILPTRQGKGFDPESMDVQWAGQKGDADHEAVAPA